MKTPLERIRSGALSLVAVFACSVVGFRIVGDYSWVESLWLVVITISTVGFSEASDKSTEFQLLTIGVIIFGVSAAVYTCGGFIQLVLEGEVEKAFGKRKMSNEIKRLNQHVIICGYGRLGQDLAVQLRHRGVSYVVVDLSYDRTQLAREEGSLAILGDATSEQVLEQANLANAKALVTALPSDAENVFITLTARNLRADIQIIAKSEQESSCRKLRQAGADKIVMPHRVGAQQMERMISRPSTADLVELFAEASHLEMELDEFQVSDRSSLLDTTLEQSKIKEQFNLLVVGIKNNAGEFRFNPSPQETVIRKDDILLVIGNVDDINRMKSAHMD